MENKIIVFDKILESCHKNSTSLKFNFKSKKKNYQFYFVSLSWLKNNLIKNLANLCMNVVHKSKTIEVNNFIIS